MGNHILKIASIDNVTHDVLRIVTDKPEGFNFLPGQATNIAINKSGWKKEERPFTFTNLPTNNSLEFTIKTYPEQESVTNELLELKQNDELVFHDVFGTITYILFLKTNSKHYLAMHLSIFYQMNSLKDTIMEK